MIGFGKSLSVATVALVLGTAGIARAADVPSPYAVEMETESGWKITVAPYIWMSGMDGNVGLFGLPPVKVNASFSDVLKNLDFGFMGVGEVRNGRFGIVTDLIYAKLSGGKKVSAGLGPGVKIDLTAQTLYWTAMGEYRLIEQNGMSLDAMAGLRLYDVSNTLKFTGAFTAKGSDGDTWVDPMIGAKARFDLGPNFYLTSWAMVGGFGAASDFAWDLFGGLGYSFNTTVSMVAGYRGMGVDYQHKGFKFDVVQHGPMIGAAINF